VNGLRKHIAVILCILLGVSLLPYNALHFHEEDHHLEALFAPNEASHHCNLDLNNCQGEYHKQCAHEHHLSGVHAKCFSCQFHFVKGYLGSALILLQSQKIGVSIESLFNQELLVSKLHKTGNKDPPSIV